jgi:CubicO group peptidase (beta-lactamase class C family)
MKNRQTIIPAIFIMLSVLTGCEHGSEAKPGGTFNYKVLSDYEIQALTEASMDTVIIDLMIKAIIMQVYPNIHSVIIQRHGKIVLEKYFKGEDQKWGEDIGIITHSKETLHDTRSISKSIVSACIGICLAKGLIDSIDQNVFDFLPDYVQYKTGVRANLTIRHLLTMSSGIDWDESTSYSNPLNSEVQMIYSDDPVDFILSRTMKYPPGQVWNYNGGTTQLLASIVRNVSGQEIDKFAEEFLFSPIGIDIFEWIKYPGKSMPAAASGLRLCSRDLLKFGQLYLNEGSWGDNQVITGEWIRESIKRHIARTKIGFYGYCFWIMPEESSGRTLEIIAAVGNGDQRIYLDPVNQMVVVVTAGNYNRVLNKNSLALLKDYIYPSVYNLKN